MSGSVRSKHCMSLVRLLLEGARMAAARVQLGSARRIGYMSPVHRGGGTTILLGPRHRHSSLTRAAPVPLSSFACVPPGATYTQTTECFGRVRLAPNSLAQDVG